MAKISVSSKHHLRVNAYDRVSSWLVALLVVTGVTVGSLLIIFFTRQILVPHVTVPVRPVSSGGGGSGGGDGALGGGSDLELPGIEEARAFDQPQLQDPLTAVASAVARGVLVLVVAPARLWFSRSCHSFTFGLLITPSGYRLPLQIPHYTKEYCAQRGIPHRTTAESAAVLIDGLPLPATAKVAVLGDTAYDAKVVRAACDKRNYTWIFPANPERVYEGPTGRRPQLRSRLKDWTSLSLVTIRLRASTGKYAGYRRLSRWRVGPKQKPRVYYAYQEKLDVRSVGRV